MKKTTLAMMLAFNFTLPNVQAVENQQQNANSIFVPMAQLPTVEAELAFAPNVPKPIERTTPAKVVVKLEALEKVMEIESGVKFKYWTFNGATPAPFIRVREGDMVEVQLANPVNGSARRWGNGKPHRTWKKHYFCVPSDYTRFVSLPLRNNACRNSYRQRHVRLDAG